MEHKFFKCKHCGNIVGMIYNSGAPIVCCGEKMDELVPNTTDAATEKHVPVAEINGDKLSVKVGSVDHPMEEKHYIEWIFVETEKGGQRKALNPGDAPKAEFSFAGDKPVAVYAYCNLHGLWKAEI